ncbi:MAG: phospholipase D-like domain-containing protein [Akkermansiaceae bacterium]
MRSRLIAVLFLVAMASCSLPDTPLWNERKPDSVAGMPTELIAKAVIHGSMKSLVSNPVTGTTKGVAMWYERSRLLSENFLKEEALLNPAYARGVNIEEGLDLVGLPKPLPGKVDLLVDGAEFFPALYRSVDGAKEQIDSQVFIFDNDDVATDFANRLRKRSKDVKCRVLMDRLGSIGAWWTPPSEPLPDGFIPPSSMPHYLKNNSQVKARMSQNPWLVADHSKLILIDRKEAYLGGMNIGSEYRYTWHDLMVRVTGPITTELQNRFEHSWKLQSFLGDFRSFLYRDKEPDLASTEGSHFPIRILRTKPERTEVEEAILVAIRMSRREIFLQNSYVTSELLLRELISARKRGVEVNFIYPVQNDSKLLDSANRRFAATLLKHGCRVYAYPKFSHVKAVMVDDWVCLGSANLDGLSMRINGELNIAYSDKKSAQELRRRVFEEDMRRSKRLRVKDLKASPYSLSIPLLQQL